MHVLRLNTILFITGSLLWYLAAGLLLYVLIAPVNVKSGGSESVRRPVLRDEKQKTKLPPVAEFATVWHTLLQRPIFDPPPPPPPTVIKPDPPKLKAQLMATAVDRGEPTAMFKIPSGKYVTLKSGETFENDSGTARIIKIEGKQVTIQFDGFDDQITISMGK
ncbi:MAG: hypothetical protein LBE12_00945, partial [Planctomycetaceae bacterium]|jgi:hypothetical protein|nr:hypothetical protein [Planctomycetaceae bacterium]